MSTRHIHLHGHRLATPVEPPALDPGPDWMLSPARGCNTRNAHLFHALDFDQDDPDSSEVRSVNHMNRSRAKATCGTCPFSRECALWALDNGERSGVWGGYAMSSVEERKRAAADLDWTPPPAPARVQTRPVRSRAQRDADKHELEQAVREQHGEGRPDITIGLRLGISTGAVAHIRKRLGLPALYASGGRRIDHELVSA